ncbi:acyl CoA:acetate/3-ketoacid CoA transferase [Natroniella sp. ANB-PHB2]|uniref:acyl CoA:acetate/3-ketoacid CoA transferase n=1 Tax=Natroniella sp. ANB-PHB2 TaxID=3384444 RepID=UPI0038D42D71
MDRVEFVSTKEAAEMISDNAKIGTVGFVMTATPEEIWLEMENRFLEEGSPKDLTLMWASGIGDGGKKRGLNHLAHEGMIEKVIGGHYGLIPKLVELVADNKVKAYNFPQGVLSQMFREMAAKKPGVLTHVGLETFVDPEYEGGKLNDLTTEDIVEKVEMDGQQYLFYKAQEIDVAIIRGTEADKNGNIGFSKEALTLEALAVAMAARNNGGKVIVQVEKRVKNGTIDPKNVVVPGAMVDVVAVVEDKKNHMQTAATQFNEDFISNKRIVEEEVKEVPLTAKKVIARRSAMQLDKSKFLVNYGIGVPELVADVLIEEGVEDNFLATVEPGLYGGAAQGGLDFGSAVGPQAIIDEPYQFDFYDGGGIDVTFLGMAQCDRNGSLNVSKFGPKIAGCGGFIDISQNSKECVFCGTFTAGGLETEVEDGELKIVQEGQVKKFIKELEQITFNGTFESKKGKDIILVTERAVFEIRPEGLTLVELAPGVDLEEDVLAQMEFEPIVADDLKTMDKRIFKEEPMGLKLTE